MNITGIYIIKNKVTNKVYIGQSIDIKKRFREHKSYLRNSNHWNPDLQNVCDKYGLDILEFKILEKCPENDLDKKEVFYINKYNSFKNGYNRTIGGKPEISENIKHNKKRLCKICNKPVKTKWHLYCENHKYFCKKCGKRFSERKRLCNKCFQESIHSNCEVCGKPIIKTSNRQKYCKNCAKDIKLEKHKMLMRKRRKSI